MPPKLPPTVASPAPQPSAAKPPPAQGRQRKRPMEIGDVTGLEAAKPFDSDQLAVPELSEARILDLVAAMHEIETKPTARDPWTSSPAVLRSMADASPVTVVEPFLGELLGPTAKMSSQSTKPKKGAAIQPFAATARLDFALTLKAVYRKIHGSGLRSHEELAAHLGANLGEIIHSEKVVAVQGLGIAAAKALLEEQQQVFPSTTSNAVAPIDGNGGKLPSSTVSAFARSTAGLPPLAILALRWWTSDDGSMHKFYTTRYNSGDGGDASDACDGLTPVVDAQGRRANPMPDPITQQSALVQRLRDLIRHHNEQTSDHSGAFAMHREIAAAVTMRRRTALLKWSGTIALLLASIDSMARSLEASAIAERAAAAAAAANDNKNSPHNSVTSPTSSGVAPLPPGGKKGSKTTASPKTAASPNAAAKRPGSAGKRPGSAGKRPPSAPGSPNAAAAMFPDSVRFEGVPIAYLSHTFQYDDAEAAQTAMERIVATLEPQQVLDTPALMLFKVTTAEPQFPPMSKRDGYVEPNPDVNESGQPRTKAERAKILCEAYARTGPPANCVNIVVSVPVDAVVPLAPLCLSKQGVHHKRGRAESSAGNPLQMDDARSESNFETLSMGSSKYAISALSKRISNATPVVAPLAAAVIFPENPPTSLSPAVLPTRSAMYFQSYNLATNTVTFTYAGRRPTSDAADLTLFYESVLMDAVKADEVANNIHNRLALRFVRPHHCRRHTAQRFSHFCHDCKAFICRACFSERHTHHTTSPHGAFCADESNRLLPKREVVVRRLQLLHSLRSQLIEEQGRMHAVVDNSIDDVVRRLGDRRAALHLDCTDRAKAFVDHVQAELKVWDAERQSLEAALALIREARAGRVNSVPVMAKRRPLGIFDELKLLLPTKQLRQLAQVLSWSNPSQYLTSSIYPPAEDSAMLANLSQTGVM